MPPGSRSGRSTLASPPVRSGAGGSPSSSRRDERRDDSVSVFFTARAGAWANRHRWLVLSLGLVAFLGSIVVLARVGANTDVEGGGTGDSGKAVQLLEERFGTVQGAPTELVIFEHPTLSVDDPAYRQTVTGLMDELRSLRAERTTRTGD